MMEVKTDALPKPSIRVTAFGEIEPTDGRTFVMGDFYTADQLRQAVRLAVIENNRTWQNEMHAVMVQWHESIVAELARKGAE